jgi:hypothetical protein
VVGGNVFFVGPDVAGAFSQSTEWYVIMNDIITIIATGKTWFDNTDFLSQNAAWNDTVSPILESIINICWLPTVIGPLATMAVAKQTPAATDWIGLIANLFFDGGGAITAGSEEELAGEPIADVVFGIAQCCSLMYGLFCGAYATASLPQ